nr:hypothetical protein [Pantoea dispersa]
MPENLLCYRDTRPESDLFNKAAQNVSFGIAAYTSIFVMSLLAMGICSQKNSQEVALNGKAGYLKVFSLAILSSVAVYFSLHSESAVFLYFNF